MPDGVGGEGELRLVKTSVTLPLGREARALSKSLDAVCACAPCSSRTPCTQISNLLTTISETL